MTGESTVSKVEAPYVESTPTVITHGDKFKTVENQLDLEREFLTKMTTLVAEYHSIKKVPLGVLKTHATQLIHTIAGLNGGVSREE